MKTSVLFLIFNRPELTKKVFEEIRDAKPHKLFIAADGPRDDHPNDKGLCEETRRLVENIDWDCEVKTLFRVKNLGCRVAVSSAIDWFFENVDEGIILEDDCLPDPSFFPYCEELLEKYRDCSKVMHISGTCFFKLNQKESYSFSRYPYVWGWATWKRAWESYDVTLNKYPVGKIRKFNYISNDEKYFWTKIHNKLTANLINTWDYQWLLSILYNKGLSIFPKTNLMENIGFGKEATHTLINSSRTEYLPSKKMISPLIHPKNLLVNGNLDIKVFNKYFNPISSPSSIKDKVNSFIWRILNG